MWVRQEQWAIWLRKDESQHTKFREGQELSKIWVGELGQGNFDYFEACDHFKLKIGAHKMMQNQNDPKRE